MKRIVISLLTIFPISLVAGQGKYLTNDGHISFHSHTAIEDITAENNEVAAVIDGESGEVAIIVIMDEFQFEKKLMQEHFNENYVESESFPKATFNGRIVDNESVDYERTGIYRVEVEGEMTIHGVRLKVSAEGTLEVTADGVVARSEFLLNPEDYSIKIPRVVRNNIAEKLTITAELACRPI